jgi:hypothetical protein
MEDVKFQFLSRHYTIKHSRLRRATMENVESQFLSLRRQDVAIALRYATELASNGG